MVDNQYKYAYIYIVNKRRKAKAMMNIDIIILLIVVVLIFQKLRSALGTRPEEMRISDEKAAQIFDIIMKEKAEQNKASQDVSETSELDTTLAQIKGFNKDRFLNSAKKAFELIVEAFAKADIETLEMLIHPKLYKKFQEVINQRQAEGISAETDFIGFDKVEITSAKISKSEVAKISVKFMSEQINLLRDKDGKIIEGDENFIQNITDVWTFERSLTSSSPNWLLVSTKK